MQFLMLIVFPYGFVFYCNLLVLEFHNFLHQPIVQLLLNLVLHDLFLFVSMAFFLHH